MPRMIPCAYCGSPPNFGPMVLPTIEPGIAKDLLREIYDKGYLNVNEPLRQRVLACLFPPSQSDAGVQL